MGTRVYLIRHGETLWNKEGRYQGLTDIELSEQGQHQAALLGRRFASMPVDVVMSSPLDRAVKTAQAIADAHELQVEKNDYFREINFGEWEGHTIAELSKMFGEPYDKFFEDPFQNPCPGEGTFEDVRKRVAKGIEYIQSQYKGKKVAIVSHGGVLRVLIIHLMGLDGSFYRRSWLSNTSITTIDLKEDGNHFLLTLNDKAHLDEEDIMGGG